MPDASGEEIRNKTIRRFAKDEWPIGLAVGAATLSAATVILNKNVKKAVGKTSKKVIRGVLHPVETKNRMAQKGSEMAKEKMVEVGKDLVRKKVTGDAERVAEGLNKGSKKAAQGVQNIAQHVQDQVQEGLRKAKRIGGEFTENMKLQTHQEHRLKGANDIKGVKDIKSVTSIKKVDDVKHLSN